MSGGYFQAITEDVLFIFVMYLQCVIQFTYDINWIHMTCKWVDLYNRNLASFFGFFELHFSSLLDKLISVYDTLPRCPFK